ncbi:MAG TPA: hypothetical protein VEU47_14510 [Candidatus Cybelea sp.]|nr:hypothetical protein [Candidatus Cybelea sp.]
MKPITLVAVACIALAGCGDSSLSGTYVPKGGGLGNGLVMEKLVFGKGDTVTVTMMEQTFRANYKIDGKEFLLILNGAQMVFNIDGAGCLDGGGLYGKYCKA